MRLCLSSSAQTGPPFQAQATSNPTRHGHGQTSASCPSPSSQPRRGACAPRRRSSRISLIPLSPSFVFLWVGPGSSDGLERGRETLARWGYRRCEVITWCITSPDGKPAPRIAGEGGVLATSAVHCPMGMRVRRRARLQVEDVAHSSPCSPCSLAGHRPPIQRRQLRPLQRRYRCPLLGRRVQRRGRPHRLTPQAS